MKILIFSWRDIKHPSWGGAEVLTMELAKRWVRKGHKVSIISAKFPGAKNQETIQGIKIFRPASFFYRSPFEYFSFLHKTANFYRESLAGQYDLVIDQAHGLPFFTPLFVKEKIVIFPFEVAKDIWFYEVRFPFSIAGYLLESAYIRLFKNRPFLTISNSTAKDLKNLGVKNIFTFKPGINFRPLKRLPRKNQVPLIVSLGRVTKMKRITETLQAFRLLHKEFPIIKLVIMGRSENEHLKELKKICLEMAIDDRVIFTGFVSENEKKRWLSQAWGLVSTSSREGWGLIVIEAAANGTPTVAYRVPGLVDSIKNEQTGLLCQKNTPVEIARNIRRLLIDHDLRKKLSRHALVSSREFSWNKAADEVLEFLKKTIAHPQVPTQDTSEVV